MLVNLSKDELCLISIALNAYQMGINNYHLDEMKEVSSRVVFLHEGLIEEEGHPKKVFKDPSSKRFRQFFSK